MRFCQISICPWESKQESNMTLSCKQISIQFSLVSAYGDNSHQLTALNMGTFYQLLWVSAYERVDCIKLIIQYLKWMQIMQVFSY